MAHQIDARHKWFFDKIADYCQLAPDVVEDQILDSDVSCFSSSVLFLIVSVAVARFET